MYASAGFIENRSALGVMSRWEYHFSHIEMMVKMDMVLVLLNDAAIRIIRLGHNYPDYRD